MDKDDKYHLSIDIHQGEVSSYNMLALRSVFDC